jgi:hypothetical protein
MKTVKKFVRNYMAACLLETQIKQLYIMNWYQYLTAFFSGMFLANAVPHFVHGISGDSFPTPFAKSHGRGLSSPLVNVLWALFNFAAGFYLFSLSNISMDNKTSCLVFFTGISLVSISLSRIFSNKDKE